MKTIKDKGTAITISIIKVAILAAAAAIAV